MTWEWTCRFSTIACSFDQIRFCIMECPETCKNQVMMMCMDKGVLLVFQAYRFCVEFWTSHGVKLSIFAAGVSIWKRFEKESLRQQTHALLILAGF